MDNLRIGNGYDLHSVVKDRPLVLGGVQINAPFGLKGHSDADVLLHAIIDALLGATSLGDIGQNFPDNQEEYQGISSLKLLETVYQKISQHKFKIINIDTVVICEQPKILPYVGAMKQQISNSLGNLSLDLISIKGKTAEKIGALGRQEGIAAYAVVLLQKNITFSNETSH